MHSSNQDTQDPRSNSGKDESPGITIEFLRARLLSERSVSRSARQRADELEKMVEELEEQLKFVSLQRKKAEKATADVLAILENQGASDISEEFDSSSDQETFLESKMGTNSRKEEECLNSERRSEHEEHSGSDVDSPSIRGRSLSWKGRNDSPRSRERSVVERSKDEHAKFDDSEENGVAASSEGLSNCSYCDPVRKRDGSESASQKEKFLLKDALTGSKEHQRNGYLDFNGHGRNKDMEKALEHQAQLIGQNEEMELAQREWEEKFRENNTSTPDSCDPGNRSDITEERDEMKAPFPAEIAAPQAQEAKSEAGDACLCEEKIKTQPNGYLPPSDVEMGGMQDQLNRSTVASASSVQEFAFPTAYEKQTQESLENNGHQPSPGPHHDPLLLLSSHNRSPVASSNGGSSFHDASGSRNDMYALVPHDSQERLGGVLDALKQAKRSLQKKITGLPLVDGTSIQESNQLSIPAVTTGSRLDLPFGCAGLFRLPTDFAVEEAASKHSYLGLGSSLPTARSCPDKGLGASSTDQYVTSTYVEIRPPYYNHVGDRFAATPAYVENRRTFSTGAGDRGVASPYEETRRSFSSNAAGQFVTSPSIEGRPPFSNNFGDRYNGVGHIDSRPTFSTNAGDRYVSSPYLEMRPNFPVNVADQFVTSASAETRSNFSADNRYLGGHYPKSWSRVSSPSPHFDPYLDTSQPSSRYTSSTTYQNYPPFPDPARWTDSDEVFAKPFPQRPTGAPAYLSASYEDLGRPNMYR
ncbi:uncharacterized protein LOC126802677 isoform X2 [Argentina anserina]|uniref:uncharacterized protein LOC126802677 isoform X2 n=1 Tax=Argentina anserina TaxID=57926 RepID=UPI0021766289|nr:uncharacterized protein LOC126802677 isoform X2 [Potentilla anserina]